MNDGRDRFSSADAGRRAHEQARRAAARAERLRDQLDAAERQQRAWEAGSEGERLVAHVIRTSSWPALHDQPWPGRAKANIDHLALSHSRIWLVDAKNWSGDVGVRQGVLRQNGYRRNDNVAKARLAADDVASALGPGAPVVTPMICLTAAGSDLQPTLIDDVVVVGLAHLASTLGPPPVNYEAMPGLVSHVERSLRGYAPGRVLPSAAVSAPPALAASPIPSYVPPLPTQRNYPQDHVAGLQRAAVLRYADWGERMGAALIDGCILTVTLLVSGALGSVSDTVSALAGWAWLGLAGYMAWLNGSKGQSPGKAVMGLRLVRDADRSTLGGPVGLVRGTLLLLMGVLTGGLLFVLTLFWPLWDRQNRSLHDKAVGASVISGFPRARFGRTIFTP
jgi:uncharacterized RDD family membrane protein YckC